jgi:hypothetical protein
VDEETGWSVIPVQAEIQEWRKEVLFLSSTGSLFSERFFGVPLRMTGMLVEADADFSCISDRVNPGFYNLRFPF